MPTDNPHTRGRWARRAALAVLLGWVAMEFIAPGASSAPAIPDMPRIEEPDPVEAQRIRKNYVLSALWEHPYRPAWWLRNRHAQTFYGPFFRAAAGPPLRHERIEMPDGDALDLHHLDGPGAAPRVLILHGLEGTVRSFYLSRLNELFAATGWNATTMIFRSCGEAPTRAPRLYHMGETTDLDHVARLLRARAPGQRVYALGISLGGNVVAKWLGEQGPAAAELVDGAAVISPPFNPHVSAPDFHEILGGFYAQRFLKTLVPKALAKAEQFPDLLDADAIRASKDFYDFDTHATAALHGFKDAEDYWRRVGCHQFLPDIRVPTLLLTSEDDPFNPAETIPRAIAEESPWLHPQWTARGGHVGFITGPTPLRARCWYEEQTLRFFLAYEAFHAAEAG